jgi:hypothetical protein
MMENLPNDIELLLQRKLVLRRRQLDLAKRFGLLYYSPYSKQDSFHRAGTFKHRMFRAGNRSGKSTMGAAEDCSWLLGYRPFYKESDPARTAGIPQHPNKGLVITNDWEKVKEIWTSPATGKIWKFLPDGFVKSTSRNHSGAIDTIVCENSSVLKFDVVESFIRSPMGSESSDFDFLHVDEPCPRDMYIANSRGLIDRNGSDWFTLTPLQQLWINDMFFPSDAKDKLASAWCIIGSTYDNPFLTKDGIAEFEKLITEDERQCRMYGLPLELSGLVYKEFRRDIHVFENVPCGWSGYNDPPKEYTIYTAIDTHPKVPHAVLFIAVGPSGLPIVYDEIFLHTSATELASLILAKLKGRNYVPPKCEPAAWIEDPETGRSLAQMFAEAGLPVLKASKGKTHGILNLKGIFNKRDPLGIKFCPTVHRTLWEIQRYCFDPKTNKPVDADDHMMEDLYRLMINNPQWINESTPSEPITAEPILSTLRINDDIGTADMSLN